MAWPLSVRTALFLAGQYLRRASIASDIRLFPRDRSRLVNSMADAPYVTAFNIDDALFERSVKDPAISLLQRTGA